MIVFGVIVLPPENVLYMTVSHPPELPSRVTRCPEMAALQHLAVQHLAGCPPPLRLSTAGREVVLSLQEVRYRAGAGWQGAGEAQQEDGRGGPHVRSGAGSTVGRTLTLLTPAADSISILPSDERGAPIAADIKHYVNMINAGADLLQEHYTARWDSPIV